MSSSCFLPKHWTTSFLQTLLPCVCCGVPTWNMTLSAPMARSSSAGKSSKPLPLTQRTKTKRNKTNSLIGIKSLQSWHLRAAQLCPALPLFSLCLFLSLLESGSLIMITASRATNRPSGILSCCSAPCNRHAGRLWDRFYFLLPLLNLQKKPLIH